MKLSTKQLKAIKKWFGKRSYEIQIETDWHGGTKDGVEQSAEFINIYSKKGLNFYRSEIMYVWFEFEQGEFIKCFSYKSKNSKK